MSKIEALKARLKIKWLMGNTQLQKQLVAKMARVSNSTISRNIDTTDKKHRKARKLTDDEMANYLDYCMYLDETFSELMDN